jgi:DNA-binding transcriptional regulator PaaX
LQGGGQADHQRHHLPRLRQRQHGHARQEAEEDAHQRLRRHQPRQFRHAFRLRGQARRERRQQQRDEREQQAQPDGGWHLLLADPGQQHERAADPRRHQHGAEGQGGQFVEHQGMPPAATMRPSSASA